MNLIDVIIDSYTTMLNDPWFWQFPMATLALSFFAFMAFALPWTALAYFEPNWMKPYRIQDKPIEVKQTFWPSIYHSIKNTLISAVFLIVLWPVIKLAPIHMGDIPAWYVVLLQIVFFIFLDDFLYYWMHRTFHENKWLLKHVHSVHHRIRNTCAINGNYMHWFEFSCTAGIMLIGPMLVGAHLYVVWAWVILRQFEAADGHMGYDLPWNPAKLFIIYHGPVYHDFHHAKFKGNYAGFLSYLDKLFGNTHVKSYLSYTQRKAKGESTEEIRSTLR